jgi:hypothetical protein
VGLLIEVTQHVGPAHQPAANGRVCQARASDRHDGELSRPRAMTHQTRGGLGSGVSPLAISSFVRSGPAIASLTQPTIKVQALTWALPGILAQAAEFTPSGARPNWMVFVGGPLLLLTTVPSLLIFAGGWQMRQLESYGLAMISAIMALIPICTLGFPLGIPIGIWALVVLSRRDVREAFGS